MFVGQLAKLFPAIYDTKCIAEYVLHEQPSYLQFLYHRARRDRVGIKPARYLEQDKLEVCRDYAEHGHCHRGARCPLSHDMQRVLQLLCPSPPAEATVRLGPAAKRQRFEAASGLGHGAAHSAGFDAWCTAYVFAHYLYDRMKTGGGGCESALRCSELYLIGKNYTLKLYASRFS